MKSGSNAEPEHVLVNSLKERASKPFDRDESARSLITESDIHGLAPGSRLRVAQNVKYTSLASDLIAQLGIELIYKETRGDTIKIRSAALGADHGGYQLKNVLRDHLEKQRRPCAGLRY